MRKFRDIIFVLLILLIVPVFYIIVPTGSGKSITSTESSIEPAITSTVNNNQIVSPENLMNCILSNMLYISESFKSSLTPDHSYNYGRPILKVNGADKAPTLFSAANIVPGYSESHILTLSNAGSQSGALTIKITNVKETTGLDGKSDTAANLICTITRSDGKILVNSPMSTIKDKDILLGTLAKNGAKGDSQIINIRMSVAGSVGNSIQGDGISFDIKYNLADTYPGR